MKNCALKKYAASSKNWVTTLNSLEMQLKKQVRPQNSNLYAYAANNPVRYIDPNGRECGYVLDNEGAHGMGHAGIYVRLDDGRYAFFELIGISREKNGIPENAQSSETYEDIYGKDTTVLSNLPNSLPSSEISEKIGFPGNSGVLLRIFEGDNAKDDMEAYFNSAGFDIGIEFATTPQQDKLVYEAALTQGQNFLGYNLIANSCGIYARNVLTTPGSGIRPYDPWLRVFSSTSPLQTIADNAIPKSIMTDLISGNSCTTKRY